MPSQFAPQTDSDKSITPEQAFRMSLIKEGLTLNEWAENRGYKPDYCSKVLNGSVRGIRGLGRQIAIEMGLRPNLAKPVSSIQNNPQEAS